MEDFRAKNNAHLILFPSDWNETRSCSSVPCSSAQLCSLDMCVQQVQDFIEGKQTLKQTHKQFFISCVCRENCGYSLFWVVSRPYHSEAAVSCMPQQSLPASASSWGWGRGHLLPFWGKVIYSERDAGLQLLCRTIKMKPRLLFSVHCNSRHTFH